jgi:hypothetical protein
MRVGVIRYLVGWKKKNSKVLLVINSISSSEHRNLCS